MDTGNLAQLIESIALILQALCWPAIFVFILIFFGTPLKKFLADVGEFTFKAGASGLEASARRKQIEAAAFLGAASAKTASDNQETGEQSARSIANVVSQTIKPKVIKKLSEASILWVDDNPSNNYYARRSLETLGLNFSISTSTEDALEKVRTKKFDVIISDMGRVGDNQAGYTLLEELKKLGVSIPYIIYSASNRPEHKTMARKKGAFGCTNNPQELFQLVLSALSMD